MQVIVAGGRDFIPTKEHETWLMDTLKKIGATIILCGMAKGADTFGEEIAHKMGLKVAYYRAQWDKFGKAAGPIRNGEMALDAEACVLFPGGRGTASMRKMAIEAGLLLVEYKGE